MKLNIIGIGPGDESLLTGYARDSIIKSDLVISTARIFETLKHLNSNTIELSMGEISDYIKNNMQLGVISVLVSGDAGFYSISDRLSKSYPSDNIEIINGLNSLQYLSSRVAIKYDNIKTISLHGRDISVTPFITYNEWVFLLTGGTNKANIIIEVLISAGMDHLDIIIGEKLSYPDERILQGNIADFKNIIFDDLTVLIIHNKKYVKNYASIRDVDIIRGKVPMTKDSIRALSINFMGIEPKDIVLDVGSGTGAVTLDMAKKAYEGLAYAIDKNHDAVELLKMNMKKFHIYNIVPIQGIAPEDIPVKRYDKVFIGGSSGNLASIVNFIYNCNPDALIELNSITLETLTEAISLFKSYNRSYDIICANIAKGEKMGSYTLMKSENPIYIMTVR